VVVFFRLPFKGRRLAQAFLVVLPALAQVRAEKLTWAKGPPNSVGVVGQFELPFDGRELAQAFRVVLPALARVYAGALRDCPLPPLYRSGVVYRAEPQAGTGVETWDDPWTCYERGWADCDDSVIWRLAEYYARGVPATVQVYSVGNRHHVRIRLPSQAIEDPALTIKQPHTKLQ